MTLSQIIEIERVRADGVHDDCRFFEPFPQRPSKIPYPPTTENIPKLKDYIIEAFATSTFLNIDEPSPSLNAPPCKIYLRDDAILYAQHTPIPTPYHMKSLTKALLDRGVRRGILKPVDVNTTGGGW